MTGGGQDDGDLAGLDLVEGSEDADERRRLPNRPVAAMVLAAAVGAVVLGTAGDEWVALVLDHAAREIWPGGRTSGWGERRDAQRAALTVVAVGAGFGIVALLCWRGRRAVGAALFGAGAGLAVISGLVMFALVTKDAPEGPEPRVPTCQEHSDESWTCPGG